MAVKEIRLPDELPRMPGKRAGKQAPAREIEGKGTVEKALSLSEIRLALKNALRYVPPHLHEVLAPEFLEELMTRGRIYGYRYEPQAPLKALLVSKYKGKTLEGKAIQLMIENNLDPEVALFPHELVTYGSNGQVCQNWMQYRLIKSYLEALTQDQTLVVMSGHPLGLFPSRPEAPRVIMTNGLLLGEFDNQASFDRAAALGVTNYGQMTAGGWMYIGPQGIVHGTFITLLNAGRKFLGVEGLKGKVFVSSGLGGMSGAQAKAIEIAGGIGIIAEVNDDQTNKRHRQGWVSKVSGDLDEIFQWVAELKATGQAASIAYRGNIVDLWQYILDKNIHIDLGSDQTSCHVVYGGGYTPQGLTYEEAMGTTKDGTNIPGLKDTDNKKFRAMVDASLRTQYRLITALRERGMYFWDYGNSLLKAIYDAGEKDIALNPTNPADGFVFPSYIEDIMGPMVFDYGYGPFRWICLSGKPSDLAKTDKAALSCIDPHRSSQDRDNYDWIKDAQKNNLVVGSQARILYQDAQGRVKIALKLNDMVRRHEIGPVMMGRDHHDPGGTDSPFRETANVKDGSNITYDMAAHCFAGNIARGMTMVVLSNGGGVGIGKVRNSGYGLVLDGSKRVDAIIRSSLEWDVMVGVSRRAWARNDNSLTVARRWNKENKNRGQITIPNLADEVLLDKVIKKKNKKTSI